MEENSDYPDATVADFESFYCSEEGSGILWQTSANCSVCGRIAQKFKRSASGTVVGLNCSLHSVCSPKCAQSFFRLERAKTEGTLASDG